MLDEYSLITIKTTVSENLQSHLGIQLVVTKDGNAVTSVKDVGVYKIAGEYNTSNFECSTQNYIFYTITGQIIVISDIFEEQVQYTYNSKNHLASVLFDALKDEQYSNICDFEIQSIARQNSAGVFAKTTEIVNAGNYKVVVAAQVKDAESFSIKDGLNVFEILVKVNKFEITKFESAKISKIYDGKTEFEGGEVIVRFDEQTTKTEIINGEFASAGARKNKAISTFTISNS